MTSISGGVERGFREALARLDERGCSLLVTGRVGSEAFAAMCRRLNGDSNLDRRRVLVGLNADEGSADRYLPDGVGLDDDHVRFIEASTHRFSTATESPSPTAGAVPEPTDLEEQIVAAIDDLEPPSGYEPGMLRLVVTSLEPLLDRYGHEAVRRWVRLVASEVTDLSVRGRAAFVLPAEPGDEEVQPLRDVFDACIEVKDNESTVLHRWLVSPEVFDDRDDRLETEWIAIPR